jgi:hypothetical protein
MNNRLYVKNDIYCIPRFPCSRTVYIKSTVQLFSVKYIYSLDLSMAADEDDLISDGKLFHKNTILLKYEFRKREGFQWWVLF